MTPTAKRRKTPKHIVTATNYGTPPKAVHSGRPPLPLMANDPYAPGGRLSWFSNRRRSGDHSASPRPATGGDANG